jgi:transcription-repair coupling factor (superfamily II helicase)
MLSAREILKKYKNDEQVQSIAQWIKPNEQQHLQISGLSGSLDAIMAAAIFQLNHQSNLFILHEKEEAAYFINDLQGLLPDKEVLFFPTSYKRPYEFEEIENANVLMRAEVLNRINHKASSGELIVTYPDALTEKVINKRSLKKNTLSVSVGKGKNIQYTATDSELSGFIYKI